MLRVSVILLCIYMALLAIGAEDVKASYKLGAQDEFSVTVQRHQELSGAYTVPPDGIIDFPRAGRLNVQGKTVAEVADALRTKYLEIFLDPLVTVVLTRARTKMATIMGAVAKPAQYPITDAMRISDLIALGGDLVGEQKELTAILKRGTAVIAVNLPSVLNGKNLDDNLLLQEGDQLTIVAPTKITVVVLGQVKNPSPVKIREGSTPVDALAQAGDVTGRPERMRITLIWGDTTTKLQEGDVIQVENEMVIRVTVGGKGIKNSGGYDLIAGSGVIDAINMAGGPLEHAALSQVTIIHANKPENEGVEHIDLSKVFAKGEITINPKLASGDTVIIPEWSAYVSVFGMVNNIGRIMISETEPFTIVDAISQAGVDQKRANLGKVVIVRLDETDKTKYQQIPVNLKDFVRRGKVEQNIVLKPNDIVYVPPSSTKPTDVLDVLYKIGIILPIL